MDLHFKSAEEIARLIQQLLSAGVHRGIPLLAHRVKSPRRALGAKRTWAGTCAQRLYE